MEARWTADVRYDYSVGGRSFSGTTISFVFPQEEWGKKCFPQRVVDRYPVGKTVRVYYHPSNPKLAVLEPGISYVNFWWLVIAVGFLALGLLALLKPSWFAPY